MEREREAFEAITDNQNSTEPREGEEIEVIERAERERLAVGRCSGRKSVSYVGGKRKSACTGHKDLEMPQ